MLLSLVSSGVSSSIRAVSALNSGVVVAAWEMELGVVRSAVCVVANTALGGVGSAGESESRRELGGCEESGVGTATEAWCASLDCKWGVGSGWCGKELPCC